MTTITTRPAWVNQIAPKDEIRFDMSSMVDLGLEPLPTINRLLDDFRPCQAFHLVFQKEPTLLYTILEAKGFEHYSELKKGVWNIYFRKAQACP